MESHQTPGTEPEPQQVQEEYLATLEEAVRQGYPMPPDVFLERYPEAFDQSSVEDTEAGDDVGGIVERFRKNQKLILS